MCQEWNMQSQQNSWEKFSVRGALSDFRSESPTAQQLGLLTAMATAWEPHGHSDSITEDQETCEEEDMNGYEQPLCFICVNPRVVR